MPLDTELEGHVTVRALSATRVQVHQRLIFTVTANGKTFIDNESFTEFAIPRPVSADSRVRQINIQIPGYGNLLADRGTITIDFTTDPWTVLFEAGPHPPFHGGYGASLRVLGELGAHCTAGPGGLSEKRRGRRGPGASLGKSAYVISVESVVFAESPRST